MGAYAPAPVVGSDLIAECRERIIAPTLGALARDGCPFRGMLYVGLMITANGPKVVEMNARWGDPEAQVVLPLLKTDLLALMDASIDGTLDALAIEESCDAAVVVMLASGGYPGDYDRGFPITGLDRAVAREGVIVFHSGTARQDSRLVTNGGRVLGVTAFAPDIRSAAERAYAAVGDIHFERMHFRRDIAHRALARLR
jgi:phosphoribosylamine--glycine ligase